MKYDNATLAVIQAAFGEACERYCDVADGGSLRGNVTVYDAHTAFSAGYRSFHAGDKYPLGPSTDSLWFRQQGFAAAQPSD